MAELVQSLSEIFSNRVFTIPDYQRGYAWDKKQWNDLTQDLELLPENRHHFTGTLILRPLGNGKLIDEEGRAYASFDVIDGQQRLTTAILFLQAIYAELLNINVFATLANGLREMYLFSKDLNQQPFTKLTLNRDSREFFADNILGFHPDVMGPTIRSHRRLLEGKEHFVDYLQAKREEQKDNYPDWLRDLYFKITQHLTVIVYEVANDLDAGVIFETMNDRGRPLTELEKVKNYLLYVCSKLDLPAPYPLDERINATWAHIFEELMAAGLSDSDNEDQLLRAHWLAIYDYDQKKWNQSRSIKDRFALKTFQGLHTQLLNEIIEYLDTLKNAATAYCDLHRPLRANAFNDIADSSLRQQVVYFSDKLARLGARASFQPLLIAVRLKANDGGQCYLETVQLCEKYDFRIFQWMRRQPRSGQSQLFRLGNDYFHNVNNQALRTGILQTLLSYCNETQFQDGFREGGDWYHWNGLRYFLYEYEQHLADRAEKPVKMPWEVLVRSRKEDTIEHILPQTPTDEYWIKRFTPEEQERWTHDYGNLTITYDNNPMKNKPFRKGQAPHDDKVGYYADSNIFQEQVLKLFPEWTVAAIRQRREEIKSWALERWKIGPNQITSTPLNPISQQTQAPVDRDERRRRVRQRFVDRAYQLGNGAEFEALLETLGRFPLYCYLNRHYQGINFTLPEHRTTWVVWVGPDLYVHVDFEKLAQVTGISIQEVAHLLDPARRMLQRREVPDYIGCLEKVLALSTR